MGSRSSSAPPRVDSPNYPGLPSNRRSVTPHRPWTSPLTGGASPCRFRTQGSRSYGESLSAMVGLSVVALAKGDAIIPYHVITGFVTPDGHIGPVGGVPLKVKAAQEARMRRVLIPEEADAAGGEWDRALSPQVSPVGSVRQAYRALTESDQGAEW